MGILSSRRYRKTLQELEKREIKEVKIAEQFQRQGNYSEARKHTDLAVGYERQRIRLQKVEQQKFVPITKIKGDRSNF